MAARLRGVLQLLSNDNTKRGSLNILHPRILRHCCQVTRIQLVCPIRVCFDGRRFGDKQILDVQSESLLLGNDTARWSGSHSWPSDRLISSGKLSIKKSEADDVLFSSVEIISSNATLWSAFSRTACQKTEDMMLLARQQFQCMPFFVIISSISTLLICSDTCPDAIQNIKEHCIFCNSGTPSSSWWLSIHSYIRISYR